jgi:phospholipase C
VLPQIDTIVTLMLENRSFDTLLGWLYPDPRESINLIPARSTPPYFDGIVPDRQGNWDKRWKYQPSYGLESLGEERWRVPRQDPNENIGGVQRQMYGDAYGNVMDVNWGHPPMTGFVSDYASMLPSALGDVMGAFTREELPILSGLARRFAVSDRWFCSVPTETDPNRAFSVCGTSQGKTSDLSRPIQFTAPTIFNGLNTGTKDWGIYYQTAIGGLPIDDPRLTFTELLFAEAHAALKAPDSRGRVDTYQSFLDGLRTGDLPSFCYLEPNWGWGLHDPGTDQDFVGWQGNDYHPPTWVGPAEVDLAELFNAIVSSPRWESMLLVITFDEHGGTWDHVPPPTVANPDGIVDEATGFQFTRLGPRVPAILVSPFVEPGTVFRPPIDSTVPFDHTSLIKTVLQWAGAKPEFIQSMGQRVAQAPTFEHALSPVRVQPNPTRPTVPAHFARQAKKGPHNLPFDASRLSLFDHRDALAATSNMDEYIEFLRERASRNPGAAPPQ